MRQYYIYLHGKEDGPFSIEDLKRKGITLSTPIWYKDITEWTTAEKLDELKEFFSPKTPPPFMAPQFLNPVSTKVNLSPLVEQAKSRKSKIIGWVTGAILAGAFCIFLLLYQENKKNHNSNYPSPEPYHQKVLSVLEIEQSHPADFLSVSGTFNENFWGSKLRIHGVIKNNATVASYKDAVVRITYLSKTKTELGNKDYTIYEIFPTNNEVKFELKVDNYKDVGSINLNVINAVGN